MHLRDICLLFILAVSLAASAQKIHRLDNITLTIAEASAFAQKTLAENHVTAPNLPSSTTASSP